MRSDHKLSWPLLQAGKWQWQLAAGLSLASLLIICFPNLDPQYNRGMDGTMPWVFNYLFDGRLALGQHIVFPHGPLAFFLYPLPLGYNLEWAILLWLLLAGAFGLNSFALARAYTPGRFLLATLFCWYFLSAFNLQLLIIGFLFSSFLRACDQRHFVLPLVAIAMASLAFFIKSYVGIVSALMVFSFIMVDFCLQRNYRRSLAYLGVYLAGILLIWLSMYGSLKALTAYLRGVAELASDNSAAAAYYPDNNWWYLSGFLLLFLLLPLVFRSRRIMVFYALSILAAFAAWKHGMARQDVAHTGQLFSFFCLLGALMLLFLRRRLLIIALVQLLLLSLFYLNFSRVLGFEQFAIDFWRLPNFRETFSDFEAYKQKYRLLSAADVSDRRLAPELRQIIGEASVDVYPWDYAFVAANGLNWQPRPVIQSYAAYSSPLDRLNAEHLASERAAEFIIWERDKLAVTRYGEELASIDNRYLLNDEPQAILKFFNYYQPVYQTDKLLLWQRREDSLLTHSQAWPLQTISWNKWVEVPPLRDGFLRGRIKIGKKLSGHLKSFFFKGEESYVYYRLKGGRILSYKIVPKNAADGIWINPLPLNFYDEEGSFEVEAIQLRNSNPVLMQEEISLQWEWYQLRGMTDAGEQRGNNGHNFAVASAALGISQPQSKRSLARYEVSLPDQDFNGNGQDAYQLDKGEFSPGFEIAVDSLRRKWPGRGLLAEASVWARAGRFGSSALVITVQGGQETLFWEQRPLRYWMIAENQMDYVDLQAGFDQKLLDDFSGAHLKVFVWNTEDETVLIRDLRIKFKELE